MFIVLHSKVLNYLQDDYYVMILFINKNKWISWMLQMERLEKPENFYIQK